jgi:hypothetical protein
MRFKVGDFATIRPDLNKHHMYGVYYANDYMCEFAGKLTKIMGVNVTIGYYKVCIDKQQYKWTEEMFVGWLR